MSSQGYLGLLYSYGNRIHVVRSKLLNGASPLDRATMQAAADTWAEKMAPVSSPACVWAGWRSYNVAHDALLAGALSSELVGSASPGGSFSANWLSLTIALVGRSTVVSSAGRPGHTIMRWHPGFYIQPLIGLKYVNVAAFNGLTNLSTYLQGSSVIWGDFYGNKCDVTNIAPIQFNAFVQRIDGL